MKLLLKIFFEKWVVTQVVFVLLLTPVWMSAQPSDSLQYNPQRTLLVGSAGAVITGGTIVGLSAVWYKDQPRTSFQFFNDNASWMQLDKVGHATTSYYLGRIGMRAMQWTGTSPNKALLIGGMYGLVYLSAVEVLDGFEASYGFSLGDMAANASGAGLFIGQQLLWNEQRLMLKYSANYSPYAKYRPKTLGSSGIDRLLKDYNGQSYWLSVNAAAWFKEKPNWLPAWLNVAVGYSGDGMLGGTSNPEFNEAGEELPYFERQRQFYLSFDIDLTRIKTRSKVLRTCFELFSFVKIPAPAIELNQSGEFRGHWVYF